MRSVAKERKRSPGARKKDSNSFDPDRKETRKHQF